jgi:AHBA synthesis associated protein
MSCIRLFDGVTTVLRALSDAGVPMAIATGKDHARTEQILTHLGIVQHFSMIVGSDDVARPKPAPDMALKIVKELRLEPRETLFVGDAVADLECGKAAGMFVGLATWDMPSQEVLRHPSDVVLSYPWQILPLVGLNAYADLVAG